MSTEEDEQRAKDILVQCLEGALRAVKAPGTKLKDLKVAMTQDYVPGFNGYVKKGGVKHIMSFDVETLRPPDVFEDLYVR